MGRGTRIVTRLGRASSSCDRAPRSRPPASRSCSAAMPPKSQAHKHAPRLPRGRRRPAPARFQEPPPAVIPSTSSAPARRQEGAANGPRRRRPNSDRSRMRNGLPPCSRAHGGRIMAFAHRPDHQPRSACAPERTRPPAPAGSRHRVRAECENTIGPATGNGTQRSGRGRMTAGTGQARYYPPTSRPPRAQAEQRSAQGPRATWFAIGSCVSTAKSSARRAPRPCPP